MAHFGLRLAVGSIFIVAGLAKFDPAVVDYLPQIGLPADLQYLFALQELVPGILIIIGVLTRISASILSAVMLGVIFYVNKIWHFIEPDSIAFPVLLLAASIIIITIGPGRISVSQLAKKIPRFLQ